MRGTEAEFKAMSVTEQRLTATASVQGHRVVSLQSTRCRLIVSNRIKHLIVIAGNHSNQTGQFLVQLCIATVGNQRAAI